MRQWDVAHVHLHPLFAGGGWALGVLAHECGHKALALVKGNDDLAAGVRREAERRLHGEIGHMVMPLLHFLGDLHRFQDALCEPLALACAQVKVRWGGQ